MHKFFLNYNNLTEKYELSLYKGNFFNNKINIQSEKTLLPEIQKDIQNLYETVVSIKEIIKDEDNLLILDKTELMISNLYYSIFASPLELVDKEISPDKVKKYLQNALSVITKIESEINIPEYNRLASLIKNNLQIIFNSLN